MSVPFTPSPLIVIKVACLVRRYRYVVGPHDARRPRHRGHSAGNVRHQPPTRSRKILRVGPSMRALVLAARSHSRLAQRRAVSNWISQLEHAKLQSSLMATVLVGVDILLYHHPMVTKRATATLMDPVWAPAFFRRQAHRIRACLTLKAL